MPTSYPVEFEMDYWYAILALVIRYAMSIVISIVGLISWFAMVFTGRQPESLQNALSFALFPTPRAPMR